MSAPKIGELWSRPYNDSRTRFLRVNGDDGHFVCGYSWWSDAANGRSTRLAKLVFTMSKSPWTLVDESSDGAA